MNGPKVFLIVTTVIATAVEPVMAESDLFRYAITQGGLLAVVLVLLWSYRKDSLGALNLERERVTILTELVGSTRETIARSADAIAAQAKSIDGLARVVEKIEERREPRG